jgi:ornithine decarboxylase
MPASSRTSSNEPAGELNLRIETPELALDRYASIEAMIKLLRPSQPIRCMHPARLQESARVFVENFPGQTFYAVKVNPEPYVLSHIYAAGVRHFDVASLYEVKLVRGMFPDAHLAFMHPIKSREAIRSAYFDYGVRDFSVDTFEELHKILEETLVNKDSMASDLSIHVRLAMPKGSAAHDLSRKFGAEPEAATQLLRDASQVAAKVGLCFHVGSQCMDPKSYSDALERAGEVIKASGVQLDVLDIGGGFPVAYPDMVPPPMAEYFAAISAGVKKLKLPKSCQIWGEPGRAVVTPAETLIVRVDLRKGEYLYINDGGFGSLYDGAIHGLRWPVSMIRPRRRAERKLMAFEFYGPTCDSYDHMKGPFMLPEDIREGDWIAVGQAGAYCASMRTNFNGFYSDQMVEIREPATNNVIRLQKRV